MENSIRMSSKLLEEWEKVSECWDANAKNAYYFKLFSEIAESADQVYRNNMNLYEKTTNWIKSL